MSILPHDGDTSSRPLLSILPPHHLQSPTQLPSVVITFIITTNSTFGITGISITTSHHYYHHHLLVHHHSQFIHSPLTSNDYVMMRRRCYFFSTIPYFTHLTTLLKLYSLLTNLTLKSIHSLTYNSLYPLCSPPPPSVILTR